jgi:hypothetical protein
MEEKPENYKSHTITALYGVSLFFEMGMTLERGSHVSVNLEQIFKMFIWKRITIANISVSNSLVILFFLNISVFGKCTF